MVAVLLGFILLGVFMVTGRVPSTGLDLVAGAAWLLPWLAGTTFISWLGSFPEPDAGNLGKLDFEAALGAEFVLSALIYLLAYRFRLSPEESAKHIEISRREAEVTDDQLAG